MSYRPAKLLACTYVLLWALWLPCGGQSPHWRQYTTEDGLPSNQVHGMLEDSRGYCWFATEQGICRFNGYEFERPVDTSARRGSDAFLPTEGPGGRIWFARLDASLWFIQEDTVRAWAHSAVLDESRRRYPIERMGIAEDGEVWMGLTSVGLFAISANGTTRLIADEGGGALVSAQVGERLVFAQAARKAGKPAGPLPLSHWDGRRLVPAADSLPCMPTHYGERGVWGLSNGDKLYFCEGYFYLVRQGRVRWRVATDIKPELVVETSEGSLLVAAHQGTRTGLMHFASLAHLRQGLCRDLLPGHFVTYVVVDRAGGWWATTPNAGVFYCKNPQIDVFGVSAGLPSDDVTCLDTDGRSAIYAGFRPTDVARIDSRTGLPVRLPRPPLVNREVQAMFFDTLTERLWCSDVLHYLHQGKWQRAERVMPDSKVMPTSGGILAKSIHPSHDGLSLWAGASIGFFQVDARRGTGVQYGRVGDEVILMRTFAVEVDADGRIWVATAVGLRLWHAGRYATPPLRHPALRFQARCLAELPGGGMAIGLWGAGLLLWDGADGLVHLTMAEGLSTDFVTKLYVSPKGEVFACTGRGLHRLSRAQGGRWDIDLISTKDGLPSDQVNDVVALDGVLWIATDRGLVRLRQPLRAHAMPAPVLERLRINNRPAAFLPGQRLAYNQNDLLIRFFALHYRSEGDILYRYRLSGGDTTYTHTRQREVNFANLAPGAYTFEVQALGEDGAWGEPTRWSFGIRAAWWRTGWFWAVLAAALAGGLALWYRRRLHEERLAADAARRIQHLEAAALRAQMNPHFIFNCLGSIQHFISEHDAVAAADYLARFARLVRLALHGSVDGEHSLREEMEMLDSYLALEQLRFGGRFSYTIEASPGLDVDDFALPPMLIQPFVENALLHGMKNKAEGGRISVVFAADADRLVATVTDNGPGFEAPGGHAAERGYRSVGMMLTQHRLALLSGSADGKAFSRENIVAEDGTVCGARVRLRI